MLALFCTRALLLGMPVPVSEAPRKQLFPPFCKPFQPHHFSSQRIAACFPLDFHYSSQFKATQQGQRCHIYPEHYTP